MHVSTANLSPRHMKVWEGHRSSSIVIVVVVIVRTIVLIACLHITIIEYQSFPFPFPAVTLVMALNPASHDHRVLLLAYNHLTCCVDWIRPVNHPPTTYRQLNSLGILIIAPEFPIFGLACFSNQLSGVIV